MFRKIFIKIFSKKTSSQVLEVKNFFRRSCRIGSVECAKVRLTGWLVGPRCCCRCRLFVRFFCADDVRTFDAVALVLRRIIQFVIQFLDRNSTLTCCKPTCEEKWRTKWSNRLELMLLDGMNFSTFYQLFERKTAQKLARKLNWPFDGRISLFLFEPHRQFR